MTCKNHLPLFLNEFSAVTAPDFVVDDLDEAKWQELAKKYPSQHSEQRVSLWTGILRQLLKNQEYNQATCMANYVCHHEDKFATEAIIKMLNGKKNPQYFPLLNSLFLQNLQKPAILSQIIDSLVGVKDIAGVDFLLDAYFQTIDNEQWRSLQALKDYEQKKVLASLISCSGKFDTPKSRERFFRLFSFVPLGQAKHYPELYAAISSGSSDILNYGQQVLKKIEEMASKSELKEEDCKILGILLSQIGVTGLSFGEEKKFLIALVAVQKGINLRFFTPAFDNAFRNEVYDGLVYLYKHLLRNHPTDAAQIKDFYLQKVVQKAQDELISDSMNQEKNYDKQILNLLNLISNSKTPEYLKKFLTDLPQKNQYQKSEKIELFAGATQILMDHLDNLETETFLRKEILGYLQKGDERYIESFLKVLVAEPARYDRLDSVQNFMRWLATLPLTNSASQIIQGWL